MKEEKVKTQRCYLRKRRGVLCVDVVAECDRYVGERWERGVCKGKEGGSGRGPRSGGGRGGQPTTIHPRLG